MSMDEHHGAGAGVSQPPSERVAAPHQRAYHPALLKGIEDDDMEALDPRHVDAHLIKRAAQHSASSTPAFAGVTIPARGPVNMPVARPGRVAGYNRYREM